MNKSITAKSSRGGKTGRWCVRAPTDSTVEVYKKALVDGQQTQYQQDHFRTVDTNTQFRVMKKDTVIVLRQNLTEEEKKRAKQASGKEFENFCETQQKLTPVWFTIPPIEERNNILARVHTENHLGDNAMRHELLKQRISWYKLQDSIAVYCKSCSVCQMKNGTRRPIVPFRIVVAERPIQHLYIDLSFMMIDGNNIGMVNLIDHFTKKLWSKAIPSKSSTVVVAFLEEVFCDIGLIESDDSDDTNIPLTSYLRSDNGGEFIANEISAVCRRYGIQKKEGAPYAPWVQGVVEAVNKTIKNMLKARMLTNNSTSWSEMLQSTCSQYNNKFHSVIKMSPNDAWSRCFRKNDETMTDQDIADRLYWLQIIRNRTIDRYKTQRQHWLKTGKVNVYSVGDVVLVRVPQRYRSRSQFIWGRKATIAEAPVDDSGFSLLKYKLQWLETGGFRKNEGVGSITAYFIHTKDLKPFVLGMDSSLEPATQDSTDICVPSYGAMDYEEEENTTEIAEIDEPPSDERGKRNSDEISNCEEHETEERPTTKMISRKNRTRKRRRITCE